MTTGSGRLRVPQLSRRDQLLLRHCAGPAQLRGLYGRRTGLSRPGIELDRNNFFPVSRNNFIQKISVVDLDPHSFWAAGSGFTLGTRIRIRIQEGQNDPQK
jgi:hypothetical protein